MSDKPSPNPRDEVELKCKCGMPEHDPIHSFTALFQKAHQFTAEGEAEVPAELAPRICEHCRESIDAHHHRNLKCPTLETIYREAFVGADGKAWPETMDAAAWAKSWLRIIAMNPDVPTDEGTMIGWFANALMRGWDARPLSTTTAPTPVKDELE